MDPFLLSLAPPSSLHGRPHPKREVSRTWGGEVGRAGDVVGGAPGALEPPVLPSSRGLSALGGSVGTRSSRRFVLVHLGAEPLMHS